MTQLFSSLTHSASPNLDYEYPYTNLYIYIYFEIWKINIDKQD